MNYSSAKYRRAKYIVREFSMKRIKAVLFSIICLAAVLVSVIPAASATVEAAMQPEAAAAVLSPGIQPFESAETFVDENDSRQSFSGRTEIPSLLQATYFHSGLADSDDDIEIASPPPPSYPPYIENLPSGLSEISVFQLKQEFPKRKEIRTDETHGSISGHVYEANGTTPVEGASLFVQEFNTGEWIDSTVSAEDGSYTISWLNAGTYKVMARKDGYVIEFYNNVYSSSQAAAVTVTASEDTPNIDFSLESGGSISGYVFESDGETPVEGSVVRAYKTDGSFISDESFVFSEGFYTIPGLLSGSYYVRAEAFGYITEYYGGVYTESLATPVTVTAPDETTDIDFSLDLGGSISGHVYDEDGENAIGNVYITIHNSDTRIREGYAFTDTEGSYTISGLPSGRYKVRAEKNGYATEFYEGVYSFDQATPIAVTAPETISGMDFFLEPGGSISGRVFKEDGATPLRGARVWAYSDDNSYHSYYSYVVTSDGSFTIPGIPSGNIYVQAAADGYVTEYYDGAYSTGAATPVTVDAPDAVSGIDFSMEPGGSISGYVYQADGRTPLIGAYVWAYKTDGTDTTYYAYNVKSDGSYTIPGLLTNTYYVKAAANGYITEFYDNVYSSGTATPVIVTAPGTTSPINFSLDVGGIISGRVCKDDGVTPIANADVRARHTENNYSKNTKTNTDGTYTITGLPSGQYQVEAEANAYIKEYYNGTYNYNQTTPVIVTAPDTTPDIDFSLDIGGSISGRVCQDDGMTPIMKFSIFILEHDMLWFTGISVTTGDGRYTVSGVPSGSYLVQVSASGYATETYDGVHTSDEATRVAVTAPNETKQIDFSLAPGGSVSGIVVKEIDTTPIASMLVLACPSGTDSVYGVISTSADGRYQIAGLPAGDYTLHTLSYDTTYIQEWYSTATSEAYCQEQATPVTVTPPGDTPGINFSLVTGGTISGNIYEANGSTPVYNAAINVYGASSFPCATVFSGTDGGYTTSGLNTGSYKVKAEKAGYTTEWYDNTSVQDTATPVAVVIPANTPGIDFTLNKSASSAPVIISPAIGAYDVSVTPYFSWEPVAGAHHYEIALCEDPTFTIIEWAYNVNDPFLASTGTLRYETTYYWRVRGVMDAGFTVFTPWGTGIFTTIEGTITGETREANGNILPGVTVSANGGISAISQQDGKYEIGLTTTGTLTFTATKTGFRSQSRTVNLTETYTVNFRGNEGLIPNAPNLSYVLACINKWKYPSEGLGLELSKVLEVINAWKNPIVNNPD